MCPSGLALKHLAGKKLLEYAMEGYLIKAGRERTIEEITVAIASAPHKSVRVKEQMQQYQQEVKEKGKWGKLMIVAWDDIKKRPPKKLKVSPLQ